MEKLNEEAAPNNNLSPKTIRTSKFLSNQNEHEFSEELSDGGERDEMIKKQARKNLE